MWKYRGSGSAAQLSSRVSVASVGGWKMQQCIGDSSVMCVDDIIKEHLRPLLSHS